MSLLQKAVETYDAHAHYAGKIEAGRQPLAPISHIITNAKIEITVDEQGRFVDASIVDKADSKTIIPATEESAGRTRAACAHPLCEQVGYLSGQDASKFALYVEQLENWVSSPYSHAMLAPILSYVSGKTLLSDLASCGIDAPGEKDLIRWRVVGIGEESGPCWANQHLFKAFIDWYESTRAEKESPSTSSFCMISGEALSPAKLHPKGIIPMFGNAKLISSNDDSGFTYRGRFLSEFEATTVSYASSQKAHNALRWLAAEQGGRVIFGGRTFLCWNPQGKYVPHALLPTLIQTPALITPTDYKAELQRTLQGFRSELPETQGGVVIAAFDAATTGRLALTYYNELLASDFLDRLHDWDLNCCWWNWNIESKQLTIQSPPLWQIVNCAFGTQRVEKGAARLVTDDRVMKQQIQRLFACRIDRSPMPADIEALLVNRTSSPSSFEPSVYRRLLFTTCAVIKKYRYDHFKEECDMSLEKDKQDRSYQFGRLLAVLDQVERDYYQRTGEDRLTNAMKSLPAFRQHPWCIFERLNRHLQQAYLPRVQSWQRKRYEILCSEIIEKLNTLCVNNLDNKLDDTYLLGYYLQRNDFFKSKNESKQEEN